VCQSKLTDSHTDRMTTVGHALPHMDLAIIDPATGEMISHDEQGEICVPRLPVHARYFELPEANGGCARQGRLAAYRRSRRDGPPGFLVSPDGSRTLIIRGVSRTSSARESRIAAARSRRRLPVEVVGVPDEYWGESGLASKSSSCDRAIVTSLRFFEELDQYCQVQPGAVQGASPVVRGQRVPDPRPAARSRSLPCAP